MKNTHTGREKERVGQGNGVSSFELVHILYNILEMVLKFRAFILFLTHTHTHKWTTYNLKYFRFAIRFEVFFLLGGRKNRKNNNHSSYFGDEDDEGGHCPQ